MSTAKMGSSPVSVSAPATSRIRSVALLVLLPFRVILWPIVHGVRALDRNFV
jgi:hypothetical protein